MHHFEVGDIVERREWIGPTRGEVVATNRDGVSVVVRWRTGLFLAGNTTTEQPENLRRSD